MNNHWGGRLYDMLNKNIMLLAPDDMREDLKLAGCRKESPIWGNAELKQNVFAKNLALSPILHRMRQRSFRNKIDDIVHFIAVDEARQIFSKFAVQLFALHDIIAFTVQNAQTLYKRPKSIT
ncbi:MAG: hypothetical protein EOP84_00955 [Verrucomicrobiaceae bacterium]|nr:MAG: hypothetical protein EOP84_00955 [Verrucomicrobiaceae bacterium]